MTHLCRLLSLWGAAGLGAGALLADRPPPQLLGNPIYVQPQALAGVQMTADGLRMTTPWMEYGRGGAAQTICSTRLCFDNFEPADERTVPAFPTDGAAGGGYDPDCGLGSGRWYFGPTYCNMFTVNDMTVCLGCQDGAIDREAFAWYWFAQGAGSTERCFVIISTANRFDETCGGPAFSQAYEGIIYDFGDLAGDPGGYYFTDVANLCEFGVFSIIPPDGRGAYMMVLAQAFDGENLTLATCAQPMLWGTKQPANCSTQGPIQWNDDQPSDGAHTPFIECYDFSFGVCPDPLGAMVCFYSNVLPGCAYVIGDANCDDTVDFFDINAFIEYLLSGDDPCSFCSVDANRDLLLDFFDIDPFIACVLSGGCKP